MSIVEEENAGATNPGEKKVAREVTVEVEAQEERPVRKAAEKTVRGWMIALGSFLILIPSYGFMLAIGVVQAYLHANQLSDYTTRDIGWIAGMFTFLALFLGIQAGPIIDSFSVRVLAPISVGISLPLFFLLAECTLYWHFMLCIGVLGGVSSAITATLGVAVIGKVFLEYRGLAMGVAFSGSSLGGVIFPLMLRATLPKWGFAWSMRAVGFVSTALLVLATGCLWHCDKLTLMDSNEPLVNGDIPDTVVGDLTQVTSHRSRPDAPKPKKMAMVNFSAFKSPTFCLLTASMLLLDFVIFGVAGLLPTMVSINGFGDETGYYLVAILNTCSVVGRLLTGIIGDRFGHFNVIILTVAFTLVCTAITLLPFGTTHVQALYAFSALWGFGSGSFLPLLPVCMGKICDPKEYGRYFGTMTFVNSFGLLISVPIGGQMLDTMGPTALSGFYVAVIFLGGVAIVAARALLIGTWFGFKEKI
ncbi:unnamed protein product [Clonostachys byssicola]|uniref:Major facilitator superfamily (MFS) profile domain-containing protein n=1 Tax=Clonostachys byssicola TaxID=160290 RepID=A0A9N9UEW8_9HYPO|nr:unnamed protein product [Clonostachys byssicola]